MFTKHKLSLMACSALVATSAFAASYTPADPDNYPYEMYKKEVKAGKNVTTLYDGAIIFKPSFKVDTIYHSKISAKNFNLGEPATAEHLKAWNTDVRPDGKGLPEGSMSVAKGYEVYGKNCAVCHGEFGEGVGKFPVLSGGKGTLTLHPNTGGDPGPLKTLGSYMPYIAPIYWYIQTAMPLSAPKSLSNSEVYGIIGYLLQVNEIQVNGEDIEDDTIIDADFLKSVHLPNEKGFEYRDGRDRDTHNTRCMTNCVDTKKMSVMRVNPEATVVEPEFGEERYYYGEVTHEEAAGSPGKSNYEAICAGCHETDAMGAPPVGDKDAWARVVEKGLDKVYHNANVGINGMPAKGGSDLSDEAMKEVVDYMIKESK
jgi:cytochrome c